jgi:hypothetical protein
MSAETVMVWAIPRSIATTKGITIVFSSSGYLDVSVLRVCFPPIARGNILPSTGWVTPFGNLRIKRLFAPTRSLSQLITSFIASESQGIHHTLLFTFFCGEHRLKINSSQYVKERYILIVRIIVNTSGIEPDIRTIVSIYVKNAIFLYVTVIVENKGVEPLTSCLQSMRSSQLS